MVNINSETMFTPTVSVIIPLYNAEKDLPDLLTCLWNQIYPLSQVEYCLINNNSQDRTSQLLTSAQVEANKKGMMLKVEQENKIQSSYAARNQGIRQTTGEIIAFTDGDCRPMEDWLTILVQPFQRPTIGMVAGELQALPAPSLLAKYAERYDVLSQKFALDHPFYPYGQTANLALRRSILKQVGLFRPYLTTGGDADLCWRIQQETDWQITFAPQAIAYHRHRDNWSAFYQQWQRYGESNRYLQELHGINLAREFSWSEAIYRLGRWLVKEIPQTRLADPIEIWKTPIELLGFYARTQGQKRSRLRDQATIIAYD
jgi:cellulose synthase/poly-beta-1,6-N-acetylglucosamine synthase-like glycosyltransferase